MEIIAQKAIEVKTNLLTTYFTFSQEYATELNGRVSRGYRIVSDGSVTQVNENTWYVTSSDGKTVYTVTFNPTTHETPGWNCNCPDCGPTGSAPIMDFCGSANRPICKHIVAVAMVWAGRIEVSQATRKYNRATTCQECKKDWQECDCAPASTTPEPARITRYSKKSQQLLESILPTEAEEEAAERALQAALKPEGRRQTRANFGRYSY